MSSFLYSVSITLVVLSIILPLPTAHSHPVDTDGNPIVNGENYYVIPTNTTRGLIYTELNPGSCLYYITQVRYDNAPGAAIIISARFSKEHYISLNQYFTIEFDASTECGNALEWGYTTLISARRYYITAPGEKDISAPFSIVKSDTSSSLPTYQLKFQQSGGNSFIGLRNGFLCVTDSPTTVSFQKVPNFIELPTSQK